jgi:hypothetical protein
MLSIEKKSKHYNEKEKKERKRKLARQDGNLECVVNSLPQHSYTL